MSNVTIIYYTSNREDPEFENKIVEGINKVKGDIPVISVSQKPMDFGKNICVGEVGYSYVNAFRQLLIGCKAAKTPFVIMAESDCLYPETGYFDFNPTQTNVIYSYNNVWIMLKSRDKFYKKEQTHGSLIYGREYLIKLIENALDGLPEWTDKKIGFDFFPKDAIFQEFSGDPIVNIITGVNGRRGTEIMKHIRPRRKIEHFGKATDLKKRLFK